MNKFEQKTCRGKRAPFNRNKIRRFTGLLNRARRFFPLIQDWIPVKKDREIIPRTEHRPLLAILMLPLSLLGRTG
jgi:hypothetical protein